MYVSELLFNCIFIVSIDVGRVTPDALQSILHNVTFCDIESEHLDGVDENFVKLFQLAQKCIQHVLQTQESLIQQIETAQSKIQRAEDVSL